MKPNWLIQTNMDGVDTDIIIAEIRSQGMITHGIKHTLGMSIGYDSNDCTICYGDIDFVRQIRRTASFVPGTWANFHNMQCSVYCAYFGKYLLNRKYIMMPVGDLLERWGEFGTYPNAGRSWFIRPNSGAKPFTGYVVLPDDKDKIQTLIQAVGPETLIIIAPEKSITAEWRFVICDRKVITGCQYLPIEEPYTISPPPLSFRLAGKIASHEWQPDLCYTIDIAEFNGAMYLLEINSFSCAGFYGCDIKSIVKYASAAAISEWKEYQDPNK